jgi:hypothetical protein
VDIFAIPLEGRSLRVAVVGADSVAASNHDDPAVIRGMIDRSKRLASPFGGPALLRQYYKQVQFASLAWVVARMSPSASWAGSWSSLFNAPATLVVSGSYLSPLHLRANAIHLHAEAFTRDAEEARAMVDQVNVFVALANAAETSVGMHGTDADVKAFFDSIQLKQEGDRAVLNAALPFGFVRKMLAGSGPELAEPATPQAEIPAKKSH